MKKLQLIQSYYQFNCLSKAQKLKASQLCAAACGAICGALCISNKIEKTSP